MFASQLNVHENTHTYFSKYDRDRVFGARGNAYDVTWEGHYEFNSEYVPKELEKAILWAVHSARDSKVPAFGICIFPAWKYTAERKHIESLINGNSGVCKLITIPEKEFDFLAPDHWKGGESEYIGGNQTFWEVEVIVVATKRDGRVMNMRHLRWKWREKELLSRNIRKLKHPCPYHSQNGCMYPIPSIGSNLIMPWDNGGTKEKWWSEMAQACADVQTLVEYTQMTEREKRGQKSKITCTTIAGSGFTSAQTWPNNNKIDTPIAWRTHTPPLRHADRLGIYTDGSCMDVLNEDGDKEARTGVGVFSQRDDVRLSFRTIVSVSVLHAVLAGILRAVEMDAQPGETSRHIYTDSLVSLHLLNKTRLLPSVMAKHKHGRTLRMILLKAGAKPQFGSSTDFVHMHFYKVPAHSGIEGNEIADELAKTACLQPIKAQVINLLEDNSMVCVIRNSVGSNIDLSKAEQQISRVELAEAEKEDEYLRCWNAVGEDDKPKIDKERSLGYVKRAKPRQYAGDEQAFRTLVRIKQCKARTLLTGKMRYAYGLQRTPYCMLCRHNGRDNVVSDVTHILGGCS
eukprot:9504100-Pyramimonas_sp.AAC.1